MMDISQLRHDTPGVERAIHMNNAGAALMPKPVLSAIKEHLDLEAQLGGYEAAAIRKDDIQNFYQLCGRLYNCRPQNIAYTTSATSAYSQALSAIDFAPGDVILTSTNDYASNFIAFINLQKRYRIKIELLENSPSGEVDVLSLARKLEQLKPKILAITHIPTNSGLIQPLQKISDIAAQHEAIFLVDGCQSVGQLPIDLKAIRCDFFSATFRKFLRGPRGAGFLYVSDRILNRGFAPLFPDMFGADWIGLEEISLRTDARRFEEWEKSYALLLGAKAAVEYVLQLDMPKLSQRTLDLAGDLRNSLQSIDGLQLLDRGTNLGALVTFHVPDTSGESLKEALNQEGINCSLAVRTSAYIDFLEKNVEWALRLSPHYYNTKEEVAEVTAKVAKLVS